MCACDQNDHHQSRWEHNQKRESYSPHDYKIITRNFIYCIQCMCIYKYILFVKWRMRIIIFSCFVILRCVLCSFCMFNWFGGIGCTLVFVFFFSPTKPDLMRNDTPFFTVPDCTPVLFSIKNIDCQILWLMLVLNLDLNQVRAWDTDLIIFLVKSPKNELLCTCIAMIMQTYNLSEFVPIKFF